MPVTGQSETLSATPAAVAPGAGTPTGSVIFTIDGTAQPAVAVVAGTATFATPPLTLGNHTFAASYSGDTNFIASSTGSTGSTTGYSICALPNTRLWRTGGTVRFYLTLCDATLHNISARTLHVTAVGVDGQTLPAHANLTFRYIRRLVPIPGEVGGGGYSYSLKTDGLHLSAGTHSLSFLVAGDLVPHRVSFTISVP